MLMVNITGLQLYIIQQQGIGARTSPDATLGHHINHCYECYYKKFSL